VDYGKNYGEERDTNITFLSERVEYIKESGYPPIVGEEFGFSIYYENSTILSLLKYFPLIQFLLIAAFIGYGYIGINSSRRAEQNRVWAGMAKETAHQLGTPITAIVAWIEHLKMMKGDDAEVVEIAHELENDVDRLNLIADRFSKIGSEPKLKSINVYEELEKCRAYMQRRASRKVEFEFPRPDSMPLMININPPLFDWVIENLLRNALDAMGGKGKIKAVVTEESRFINIDISDTGSGIPSSKFKKVFKPGFTTKKRGWGLGLSLAKRIIETYHAGRIFVKKSVINEGTTFSIKLPKS
ncbi:MAG: HAMP domain-containing sensor histidine kinase, partial [Bacteroidota bacterium]